MRSVRALIIGDMKNFPLLILLALLVSLAACEEHVDLSDQKRHTINEFSFSIPANWEVIQEAEEKGVRYLHIESPGLALVQVAVYDQEASFTLREYSNYSIENTEKKTLFGSRNEGTLKTIKKSFAGKVLTGYRNEYIWTIIVFPSQQVTEFFKLPNKNRGVFITTMAPEDNLIKVEKGFDLIISSFRQERRPNKRMQSDAAQPRR